ncbi:MAG: 4-hydroxythreonine-4-phosphate dehydrogenase PdxA [Candidatus Omnitrophota bacterium]
MNARLAVTMGDPGGIGPEVLVKAFRRQGCLKDVSFFVIGHGPVLRHYGFKKTPRMTLLDPCRPGKRLFSPGPSRDSGKAALECLRLAAELARRGEVSGLVTAPVSKEVLKPLGFRWPGQTEFLREALGAGQVEMVFVSDRLKVALVTRHVSLQQAIRDVRKDRIISCGRMIFDLLRGRFGLRKPRVGVCGLNPHAGESGLFGQQERLEIAPAIRCLNRSFPGVFAGPLAPDSVFHRAYQGEFDMVLCMYHDQGLIPFKMTEFNRGVHLTAGLPVVRTSPVHGTAYDIAGKNRADEGSMLAAILLARRLVKAGERA